MTHVSQLHDKYYKYNKPFTDRNTWKTPGRIMSVVSRDSTEVTWSKPDNPNCERCQDRGQYWEPRCSGRSRLVCCGCKTIQ